jgi:hypothetical protein
VTRRKRVAAGLAASALAVGLWTGAVHVGPDPNGPPARCTDELGPGGRCDPPSPATCLDAWSLEAPSLGPAGSDQGVEDAFVEACLAG